MGLEKDKVNYIIIIKDTYNNVVTSIWTSDRGTSDFLIKIEPHPGMALGPYLFTFVMNEVTRDIQDDIF
jgi:hypothetical protein